MRIPVGTLPAPVSILTAVILTFSDLPASTRPPTSPGDAPIPKLNSCARQGPRSDTEVHEEGLEPLVSENADRLEPEDAAPPGQLSTRTGSRFRRCVRPSLNPSVSGPQR